MNAIVSGLINIETTLKVRGFPINYYPVDYPFFGIQSSVSGVGYNVAKALLTLGNNIELASFIANDEEGKRILSKLKADGISARFLYQELKETPVTVALNDSEGRRQIHCDLKDIQEKTADFAKLESSIRKSDLVALCNVNFNRPLLKKVKALGKLIATDVHALSDINDEYNKDFMEHADILFLSDERLPSAPEEFILELKKRYPPKIIVVGLGNKGALLYDRAEDKRYKLEPAHVGEVVNTLGAGDALFSSLIHYYVKGCSTVEALTRAQIFAALKIRHNGAANGFSDEVVIEKFYRQTKIVAREVS
ncbi:MAG TPA: carbohydrate kinase family protein [Spirochaetota bacterium]|nr:carbohydrate kinase family protein [Spirochaetota bacterium]HOS32633.1 carbohydrate kinase family protein [Spirochaetota bacterium]HOS56042.1 carbohydrate kinase family protein [Spirochaetota bacterium]HPK61024.1 carbohydrate kinase family protein [Spirochaetota bacterium]HQF78498.1 carbohydrate kinase family protein [Spirochaetota bacterium]